MDSAVHQIESQSSSSSDVVEGHYLEPPDDGYPVVTQSRLLHENDSPQVQGWKSQ